MPPSIPFRVRHNPEPAATARTALLSLLMLPPLSVTRPRPPHYVAVRLTCPLTPTVLMPVDAIPDVLATVGNVTADMTATAVVTTRREETATQAT